MKQKPIQKTPVKPAAKTQSRKEEKKGPSRPFFLDPYMKQYGLWITLGLVFFLILVIFHEFILGNKYYLFKDIGSDSINISLPQVAYLVKYLKSDGFPMWSFAQGMGQNIMPHIADPFSWVILLGFGDHVEYGFFMMEMVKMLLAAVFFYLFLSELKLSYLSRLVGTLLYTFSGFMIIGSGWGIFSAEACLLALLLLAFEKLYNKNSWLLFPLPVVLILLVQPFDLYLYGLFLIIYFLLRHFTSTDGNWRKLFLVSLKMALLVLLGVLISSFFLASTVQMILDSPRIGGNSSYANKLLSSPVFATGDMIQNGTTLLRFYSNDLLGTGSGFKGWYNYLEAPMVYIGLLPLLLFPQVFLFLDRRRRILYGIFFAVFFLPVVFPFFRYAFWAFTGDYYRGFSLFIALALLLFTLEAISALDRLKKINLPLLITTLVILIGLLYYPFPNIDQVLVMDLRSLVILFLVLYAGVVTWLSFSKNRSAANVVLLCLVIIEIGYMNARSVGQRDVMTRAESRQKTGYNDYTMEASAYVRSIDPNFFRVNKDYSSGSALHDSWNDAKMQDYYGTVCYSSFNQKNYIRFLEETGIIVKGNEFESRWARGFRTTPFLQLFGSVKYNFSKTPSPPIRLYGYDSLTQVGDVKILRTRFSLPLGFTYDRHIPLTEYRKLPVIQKQMVLYRTFVSEEPANPGFAKLANFTPADTSANYTWEGLGADVKARKADSLKITAFSNNRITGTIELQTPKLLFFTIPFDRGWHCTVDGKPSELILANIGFTGLMLEPGKHNVTLFYKPPWFTESLLASVAGILVYLALAGWVIVRSRREEKPIQNSEV